MEKKPNTLEVLFESAPDGGKLCLELPLQNFADQCRVGFALGELHHLAFEGIQRGDLAAL
jgi:hypothetical protein